ncbi:prominin-like protein [Drosophila novamexicana]|uniref:prominin-like protein n=1 Tax=Drosophila novamexicana TaxID=47314 RepID=UPI0011E5D7D8|nr:prominin-like protein [Drosophila novamexicana]XP_030560843.1 prominin-like protein [Drosophila novamexicana]XP_030560844.1 prominin-like protein [Drosophila novamexicana]
MEMGSFKWHIGSEGHDTTHEKHYPNARFSQCRSETHYDKEPDFSVLALRPIFHLMHTMFDKLHWTELPSGYIQVNYDMSFALGPKVLRNDWNELLAHYWLAFLGVVFMIILIIITPLIGVLYCCFLCCCRRCPQECEAGSQ